MTKNAISLLLPRTNMKKVMSCKASYGFSLLFTTALFATGVTMCVICTCQYGTSRSTIDKYERSMGWLRLVGSFKLQVSSAEHSLFFKALLQMRPMILRSLLIVATPESCGVWRCMGFRRPFEVCYQRRGRQSVWCAHDKVCDNVYDIHLTKCVKYTWLQNIVSFIGLFCKRDL